MNDNNREKQGPSGNDEEKRRLAQQALERQKAQEAKIREEKESQLRRAAMDLSSQLTKMVDKRLPDRLASIVKTHAWIAVLCAFLPIPGLDIIAAGVNIWTMYARINKEAGRPFEENMFGSIIIGIIANVGSALIGLMVLAVILKMFPGPGTFTGVVVMVCIIYSVTMGAGVFYLKAVTKLLKEKETAPVVEKPSAHTSDTGPSELELFKESVKQSTADRPNLKYQVHRGEQRFGPYGFEDLKRYTLEGNIRPNDWLWHEGLDGWITVRDFFLKKG